jgi:hypothetical protein
MGKNKNGPQRPVFPICMVERRRIENYVLGLL